MSAEQYSHQEKMEIVDSLGTELREGQIKEDQYRQGLGRLGFNATDIEAYLREAMKST